MIISSHLVALDDVIESPEVWHAAYASPESIDVLLEQLERVDAYRTGRSTG